MSIDNTKDRWEKRWHPLRKEWIIYAAHRNTRPWTTGLQELQTNHAPAYDPNCYLCPTNIRVHGDVNEDYKGVFIFDNDHPVVGLDAPEVSHYQHNIYKKESAKGIARVVCYDPRHNVTLSDVSPEVVADVLIALQQETIRLSKIEPIKTVFVFENKGKECGVSNPHPHCQIYATDFVFSTISEHLTSLKEYRLEANENIFEKIIEAELSEKVRIIAENEQAVAFIPFFARYAYEVMIFPKKHHSTLVSLSTEEMEGLAKVYWETIKKLDLNAGHTFPYVMSVMQAPFDQAYPEYWVHLHLLPPYRAPGLLKYLGGPESLGGTFMADTMPEEKAKELNRFKL